MLKSAAILFLFLFTISPVAYCAGGGYIGGQFGANLLDASESQGSSGSFNLTFVPGMTAAAVVGYDLGEGGVSSGEGRIEIEGSWRRNELDTVEFQEGNFSGGGDVQVFSILLNSYADYHGIAPLVPYAGIGGGWARVILIDATVLGEPLADDADDVLVWQAGAGLGLKVTPSVFLDLGYRFFASQDLEFEDSRGRKFSAKYHSSTILLGARYSF